MYFPVAKLAVAAIQSLSPRRTTLFAFADNHERRLLVLSVLSPECRGQSPKIPAIRTAERVRAYLQLRPMPQTSLVVPYSSSSSPTFLVNPQNVRMIPAIYDPHCNLNWPVEGAYAVCRRHMISSGILSHLSESTLRCSRRRYAATESRPRRKFFNEATDPANVIPPDGRPQPRSTALFLDQRRLYSDSAMCLLIHNEICGLHQRFPDAGFPTVGSGHNNGGCGCSLGHLQAE